MAFIVGFQVALFFFELYMAISAPSVITMLGLLIVSMCLIFTAINAVEYYSHRY